MKAITSSSAVAASTRTELKEFPLPPSPAVRALNETACGPHGPRDWRDGAVAQATEPRDEPASRFEQLVAICDLLPTGCAVVTSGGKIAAANRTLARWLGFERSALRDQALQQFLPPFEAGRFVAQLEMCHGSRDTFTLETMLTVQGERALPVLFTSRARKVGSEALVVIVIAPLEAVRQVRADTRELEQDHAVLTEALLHNVRAPLVTLRSFAHILRDDCASAPGGAERELIDRIERTARRVETNLQQLLAYVNLRREEPELIRLDTEQLALGVVAQWRERAARRHAEITLARPMPAVRGCPRLLTEALSHLLGNALDFASPDRRPHLRISCDEREGAVIMNIADNGAGIRPEYLERIFRPGECLLPHPEGLGAGFGLAIVRRAVEKMEGRVWAESEPGRGSCFHLVLRRA